MSKCQIPIPVCGRNRHPAPCLKPTNQPPQHPLTLNLISLCIRFLAVRLCVNGCGTAMNPSRCRRLRATAEHQAGCVSQSALGPGACGSRCTASAEGKNCFLVAKAASAKTGCAEQQVGGYTQVKAARCDSGSDLGPRLW